MLVSLFLSGNLILKMLPCYANKSLPRRKKRSQHIYRFVGNVASRLPSLCSPNCKSLKSRKIRANSTFFGCFAWLLFFRLLFSCVSVHVPVFSASFRFFCCCCCFVFCNIVNMNCAQITAMVTFTLLSVHGVYIFMVVWFLPIILDSFYTYFIFGTKWVHCNIV